MKKVLIMSMVLSVLFVFSAFAAGPPQMPKPPKMVGESTQKTCQPGTSCSENYAAGEAKILEVKLVKKIELKTFLRVSRRTPINALYAALNQTRAWLALQNVETIISQSQTVHCTDNRGTCDAFVTIMYWRMVPLESEKK